MPDRARPASVRKCEIVESRFSLSYYIIAAHTDILRYTRANIWTLKQREESQRLVARARGAQSSAQLTACSTCRRKRRFEIRHRVSSSSAFILLREALRVHHQSSNCYPRSRHFSSRKNFSKTSTWYPTVLRLFTIFDCSDDFKVWKAKKFAETRKRLVSHQTSTRKLFSRLRNTTRKIQTIKNKNKNL